MKKLLSVILAFTETLLAFFGIFGNYEATPGEELSQSPFYAKAEAGQGDTTCQDIVLPFNAVYRLFGGTDKEHSLVYRFGNEPTYFEWMALKLSWTGDKGYISELKDKIISFPQTDSGYLWSWGTSPYWPTGKGAIHYDGLFRYVAAVYELIRWERNTDLLIEKDRTTVGNDPALDCSEGKTVYEKCKAIMDYAYDLLDGKNGLITITERSVFLSDGVSRFDINQNGEKVWNNTGRAGSSASNYWDNLCFGNIDAYETALYYHALRSMSLIEKMREDTAAEREYITLAEKVKDQFNKMFWSKETGRYIACVDVDGKKWDPGLTFLNTEALTYGLGDEEKARSVFSWLDGTRKVSGDTVTGKDIMNYSRILKVAFRKPVTLKKYRFAPITNTVSIEKLSGDGAAWWYGLDGAIKVGKGNNAEYGHHLENGGYIFYPLYYELTAREMYLGADNVAKRVRDLTEVYRRNGFNSDVGGWVEGMIGEFPESGIVSRAYVSSLCGIEPSVDALIIKPDIPSGVEYLGTDRLSYGEAEQNIKVGNNTLEIKATTALNKPIVFYPKTAGRYRVLLTFADGMTETFITETDSDNSINLPTPERDIKEALITPAR
ncbi:MAG: hypothetical protein K6F09_05245 [Clostridiales bacterium]|nr:hypothetical protein [Clostridiales bacterium]